MADEFVLSKKAAAQLRDTVRTVEALSTDKTSTKLGRGPRLIPQPNFNVRVTKDGGSAGSDTTNCSYTYTVKLDAGDTLGTGLTPQKARYPNTPYTYAPDDSWGTACWDKNGDLVLNVCWKEIAQVGEPCEEEGA